MQIYSESSGTYLPLCPAILLCILGDFSPSHCICVISFTLIYSVGVGEESYYNMAWAVVIGILCLVFNVQEAAATISAYRY